jgi:predicted ATPase/class 3 adenylate cyclase
VSARRERKIVTVLFADLVGFTARSESLDPEDVEAILRPYHERLRRELEHFGGTVEKFIGDAVMALFGAPVAHEDDPERAVRAALAIRDWARAEDGVQVRIAVNTGEALVNLDARPEAGEGMAAGDVVNTTARMQSSAPVNGVLVGDTTYRATGHVFSYRAADAIEAKGKIEPIPAWEAVEAKSRFETEVVSARVPLVGRERDLEQLVAVFERARTEHAPQLVTIVGVPGIGKSRLVAELYAIVDADPQLVYWRHGRSLPYGEGVTFWAVGEMVKAQAGILETDTAERALAKLRAAISELVEGTERDSLEENLRPLVGLERESELAGDRRTESFAAWRRFFEALADRRPLVLAFEDLHWADDDLLDFVDELVEWLDGVPLLVLCTARPELLDRRPNWGGGKRNAVTISLNPLTADDTARLISQLLERAVLPAETQTALLAKAGGNPLYAEQFARMFVERGEATQIPETLQGIIASRLDSLDARDKSLLQDAAVFGKAFWTGALAAVAGVPLADLERSLRGLARREFVRRARRSSVADETEYEFGHVLVRDVAYGQIPRADRAAKHRAAAAWIESLAPDRSEDRADMLAHHYLAALEFARAAGVRLDEIAGAARSALRAAAERAVSLGSYRQAIRLYDAALELWPEGQLERTMIALRREDAVYEAGDFPDLERVAEIAAALAAAEQIELAAESEMLLAKTAWARGQGDLAAEHGDRALALVADADPSPTKAQILVERARLAMLGYQHDRSRALLREGLPLTEEFGLDRLRASALITLGTMPSEHARETLERGIALAEQLHDVQQTQRGYNNLAELNLRSGDVGRALEAWEAAERSTRRSGARDLLRWLQCQQGTMYYFIGNWDRSLGLLEAFFADPTPHYMETLALATRAMMRYSRGDRTSAEADIERAIALARGIGDPQALATALHSSLFYVKEGRAERASALLDEYDAIGYVDWFLALDAAVVRALIGREKELRDQKSRIAEAWHPVLDALADLDFASAADAYAALGLASFEGTCRLEAAGRLAAAGDAAAAGGQARRALAFYRSVRASRYAGDAEALLEQTA